MLVPTHGLLVFMALLATSCFAVNDTARPAEKTPASPLDAPALFAAPDDPAQWDAWRENLITWRRDAKAALHYDDHYYNRPEFAWTTNIFSCYYVMLWDERFLDFHTFTYRTDAFLQDVQTEFGPIDGLVIWHGYPNLGFDRKTQFDMYRNLPGGLDALRQLADTLHARNIRLFVCFNPWDTADGVAPDENIARMVEFTCAVDADGVFLDTWTHGPENLLTKFSVCRPGVALESELDLPLQAVATHHFSWAQWIDDSAVPGVFRNKWLEPRHIMHLIRRWDSDHSGELHTAWMNGAGIFVWENVFGSYNPWSERDKYLLRGIRALQTYFADWFTNGEWTPLVPTQQPHVYASSWTTPQGTLWTIVNRSENTVTGNILNIPVSSHCRWFNLLDGTEITPEEKAAVVTLTAALSPRALGGFVALNPDAVTEEFLNLLRRQRDINSGQPLPRRAVPQVQRVSPLDKSGHEMLPSNMRLCPGGLTTLKINYRLRENGFYQYAPLLNSRFPTLHTPGTLEKDLCLPPFAIDMGPVTNRRFKTFLDDSNYRPACPENFLKHWVNGEPPKGEEDNPVGYVNLDDARAYAAFYGKRLPSEYEWQYAGVQDFLEFANRRVWEWTESVHSDGRTRFCMLKGGSDYQAQGSPWYADGGPRPCDFAAKYILTWPGLDRCATIGFRCAVTLNRKQADNASTK